MADVDIIVAGRAYQLACRAGDEANLRALGSQVDAAAANARQVLGGGASEGRLLLLTAMMLADEVNDLRAALDAPPSPARVDTSREAEIAEAIESIAARLERLAEGLESGAPTP